MPLLYSYISPSTDPEKLWAIKRRVAKSLREANDDERGLAETADMSEDTDNLILQIMKILDKINNSTNYFLNEKNKLNRPTDQINIPSEFDFSLLDIFSSNLIKIDINKMNASNIEKLTEAKDKLNNYTENLTININNFKYDVSLLSVSRIGRPPRGTPAGTPADGVISRNNKQQAENLIEYYEGLIGAVNDIVNELELKLLNYRQTTAVLKEEGIEMLGGCMCDLPFEYRPQYQNRMYY